MLTDWLQGLYLMSIMVVVMCVITKWMGLSVNIELKKNLFIVFAYKLILVVSWIVSSYLVARWLLRFLR